VPRRSTQEGNRIAEETRVLARRLHGARARYWSAILARPQLAPPLIQTIRSEVETHGWDRRLVALVYLGRRWVETRRVRDRRIYQRACRRAGEWLAGQDRDCRVANACADAIDLWAGRSLPRGHRWAGVRIYPARVHSRVWQRYWSAVEETREEREGTRNAIVMLNEGLVIHYVQSRAQWMLRGQTSLTREDLQQHAREGLHRAADLYDPDRPNPRTGRPIRFSTYAMHWLRHFVDRGHQTTARLIRLPLTTQVLVYRIGQHLDQHPRATVGELATALSRPRKRVTQAAVRDALECLGWSVQSMDAPLGFQEGRALTLADLVPDPSELQDEVLDHDRVLVRMLSALEGMDPDDREVIGSLYGLDGDAQTAQQVARRLRWPRERVELVHDRALTELRSAMAG